LSPPEPTIDSDRLGSLLRLPREGHEPVFAEPWQAQAFALVIELSKRGYFTWPEWTQALAQELKAAAVGGESDDGSRYYEHWLAALERLVLAKGLTDSNALAKRKSAWTDAYRHTPHGKPVVLPTTSSS
jgi:nitrile hydratase accessory protein